MRQRILVYPNVLSMFGLPQVRPVSDIPNQVGFKLILVKHEPNGDFHTPATVQKDASGMHVCVDGSGTYRPCTQFDGWLPSL